MGCSVPKQGTVGARNKYGDEFPRMSVTVVPIRSPINREQRLLLPTYISLVYLSSVPVPAILITNNFSLEYINCHSSTMLFIVSLMMIAAWGSVCFKTKYFESVNYCGQYSFPSNPTGLQILHRISQLTQYTPVKVQVWYNSRH